MDRRPLHLGVALDGAGRHPAAWREPDADAGGLFGADRLVRLAQLADGADLDFVTLDDSFDGPGVRPDRVRGRLDALLALARVAPITHTIGLIPTVTTTHTEPFHASKNLATLDHVSGGRAGWRVAVSATVEAADHFGRKSVAPTSTLWAEAADTIEVVRRLWDSWEDDAVIRDVTTGRYVDRDKLHYVDFEGDFFSVRGPSITPRSPQAQPLVMIEADGPEAAALAVKEADIIVLHNVDADVRSALRDRIAAAGREPDDVAVLARVDVLLADDDATAAAEHERLDAAAGESMAIDLVGSAATVARALTATPVDGFLVGPARLPHDLQRFVADVLPLLPERVREGTTLRDHFGLTRPPNRYTPSR